MRSFADDSGEIWQVTIGRESWGNFVLLYTPSAGGAARKSVLTAETALQADRELDELSDSELRNRLRDAVPWAANG